MSSNCSPLASLVMFVGRICFSLIFIIAGIDKIIHFSQVATMMANKGIEASALVLILAIVFELGGGILILIGLYTRFAAILLFLFIIPVTFVFHSYWTLSGTEMVNNFHHFFKNLAMLGATLYFMACGAGHISIDGFMRKKCSLCCKKKAE